MKVTKRMIRNAVIALAACAVIPSYADGINDFYFRYDFTGGVKVYEHNGCETEPSTSSSSYTSAYGPAGYGSAVHPGGYGLIANGDTLLNNDWSVAMSVRPWNVNKGVLLSLGGNGSAGWKQVLFCSSSTSGNLHVAICQNNNGSKNIPTSVDITNLGDTIGSFHTLVAVYTGSDNIIKLYWDGTLVKGDWNSNANQTDKTFPGRFQFCNANGGNPSGYSGLSDNMNVAFQDLRFFTNALSAAEVALYAQAYPAAPAPFDTIEVKGVALTYVINDAAKHTVTLGDGINPAMATTANLDAGDIPWTFTNNGTTYSVTKLADSAFNGCTALTGTLAIPASVTSIGSAVFSGCTGLVGVSSFGDGCTTQWGQQVFRNCTGLRGSLVVPDSNPCNMNNFAFDGCLGIESIIIGSGTTWVPRYFASNSGQGSSALKGVWIKGRPTVASGTQAYTTVCQPYTFRYAYSLEVILYGRNTKYDANYGANLVMMEGVNGCSVFVPANGQWTNCKFGGTNTDLIYYGADQELDLDIDDAAKTITAVPNTSAAFEKVLNNAARFKEYFDLDTRIAVTNSFSSTMSVSAEKLQNVTFLTYVPFVVNTQAQLDATLAAIPDAMPIAIDATSATENINVPAGRNVVVLVPGGGKYGPTLKGFIILVR